MYIFNLMQQFLSFAQLYFYLHLILYFIISLIKVIKNVTEYKVNIIVEKHFFL